MNSAERTPAPPMPSVRANSRRDSDIQTLLSVRGNLPADPHLELQRAGETAGRRHLAEVARAERLHRAQQQGVVEQVQQVDAKGQRQATEALRLLDVEVRFRLTVGPR